MVTVSTVYHGILAYLDIRQRCPCRVASPGWADLRAAALTKTSAEAKHRIAAAPSITTYELHIAVSMSTTTIPLDKKVRDRLKKYGTMGTTYNKILTGLMDQVDRAKFIEDIRHRAATNRKWTKLEDL